MAIEIERKAWVRDPDGLRTFLITRLGRPEAVEKRDEYFIEPQWAAEAAALQAPAAGASGARARRQCRLRQQGSRAIATAKVRRLVEGTEVNQEIEFEVSAPDEYRRFVLEYLGFEPHIDKHKRTLVFRHPKATVELSEVMGLGWFLEVEVLADSEDELEAVSRGVLDPIFRECLQWLGPVEERQYTALLKEARGGQNPRPAGG
jgi:adenylate cyclase class 2